VPDIAERRRALLTDVRHLAGEMARLVREARELNLPVEPGVRAAGQAFTRWAHLLHEVIPPKR
jgi:hypothetical protein